MTDNNVVVDKKDWWGKTVGRFIEDWPYYLPFIHIAAVELVDKGYLGSIAWTGDCLKLRLNVPELSKLPIRQQQGVLEHELAHYFLKHLSRRRRDKLQGLILVRSSSPPERKVLELMNVLYDMEINTLIGKVNLPSGCVFAEDYGLPPGLTAEEYLELIPPEDMEDIMSESTVTLDIKSGEGECSCGGGGDAGETDGKDQNGDGEDGETDGQKPLTDLKKFLSPDKVDIRLDGKPLDDLDDQQLEERIEQAQAEQRRGRGNTAADWDRLLAKLNPPKLKWVGMFKQMTASHLRSSNYDPTYARLNRRVNTLPGKSYKAKPKIFIFQDTSGSVSDRELAALASEIYGLRRYSSEIWLAVVDAAVHDFYPFKGTLKPMSGGGGSDFTPAFEAVWDKCKNTSTKPVIILLTDGDIGVPPDPKGATVFWVLCHGEREVPYGKTIVL